MAVKRGWMSSAAFPVDARNVPQIRTARTQHRDRAPTFPQKHLVFTPKNDGSYAAGTQGQRKRGCRPGRISLLMVIRGRRSVDENGDESGGRLELIVIRISSPFSFTERRVRSFVAEDCAITHSLRQIGGHDVGG